MFPRPLILLLATLSILTVDAQTWNAVPGRNKLSIQGSNYLLDRSLATIVQASNKTGFYLFGGKLGALVSSSYYDPDCLWYFNLTTFLWSLPPMVAPVNPLSRDSHVLIPHSSGLYAFLHGGEDSLYNYNDVWILDLTTGAWTFALSELNLAPKVTQITCNTTLFYTDPVLVKYSKPFNMTTALTSQIYTYNLTNIDPATLRWWDSYPLLDYGNDTIIIVNNTYWTESTTTRNLTSTYDCSTVDYTALPYPYLFSHAGTHDPVSDTFYINGGYDQNDTMSSALYSFKFYQKNSTWFTTFAQVPATGAVQMESHSLSAVTINDGQSSLLVAFGGYGYFPPLVPAYATKKLYILDTSLATKVWTGPYQITGPDETAGHSASYIPDSQQLWITGGQFSAGKVFILDINGRNVSNWAWRFGPGQFVATYFHSQTVIKTPTKTSLFKFGGLIAGSDTSTSGQIEQWTLNVNTTIREGTLVAQPGVPPPPSGGGVIGSQTVTLTTRTPTATKTFAATAAQRTTTATSSSPVTTDNLLFGVLSTSMQILIFGSAIIVLFLLCFLGSVYYLKLKKKARPAKSNFYSL